MIECSSAIARAVRAGHPGMVLRPSADHGQALSEPAAGWTLGLEQRSERQQIVGQRLGWCQPLTAHLKPRQRPGELPRGPGRRRVTRSGRTPCSSSSRAAGIMVSSLGGRPLIAVGRQVPASVRAQPTAPIAYPPRANNRRAASTLRNRARACPIGTRVVRSCWRSNTNSRLGSSWSPRRRRRARRTGRRHGSA